MDKEYGHGLWDNIIRTPVYGCFNLPEGAINLQSAESCWLISQELKLNTSHLSTRTNFYISWARSSPLCRGFWRNPPSPERPSPLCAGLPRSPFSTEAAPCGGHQATACPPPSRHASERREVCFVSAEGQPLTQRRAAHRETGEPGRWSVSRWRQDLQRDRRAQSASPEVYRGGTVESIWKSFPGKPRWSSQLFLWVYTSSFLGLRSGSWRCPAWAPID